MTTTKLDHQNAVLRICVDKIDAGRVGGRVYGQRLSRPILFSDIDGFFLQTKQVLDAQNFPQAHQRIRSFVKEEVSAPNDGLPQDGMSAEMVASAHGAVLNFRLSVISQRSATWQGTVDWLDGEPMVEFSSDMELLKLLIRRLFGD